MVMAIKRCKLGTIYTTSPAQRLGRWAIGNLAKIIFSIVCGIIWMAVFFLITGIIRFCAVEVAQLSEDYWQETTWLLYQRPEFVWANAVGVLVVVVYVLCDRLTKR